MDVDDTIYVSLADLIGLDEVDFADLAKAIHEDAECASEISVPAGCYGRDALVELCRRVPRGTRAGCVLRIAVGLVATALIPRTWADVRLPPFDAE